LTYVEQRNNRTVIYNIRTTKSASTIEASELCDIQRIKRYRRQHANGKDRRAAGRDTVCAIVRRTNSAVPAGLYYCMQQQQQRRSNHRLTNCGNG